MNVGKWIKWDFAEETYDVEDATLALVRRVQARRQADGLAFRYRDPLCRVVSRRGTWFTYHAVSRDQKLRLMDKYCQRGFEVEEL